MTAALITVQCRNRHTLVAKMTILRTKKASFWLIGALICGAVGYLAPLAGSSVAYAESDGGELLVSRLKALRPDIPIENVTLSPLPGIYVLELSGGSVFYGTEDGRFLFAGDLYELTDTELVNIAEIRRVEKRQELMASVDVRDMVVFPASSPSATRAVINVFTDVDCGYCRKLHKEVPELNSMGIEVRYLAYPRAGIGSDSYQKIVSAWCAEDRNAAITQLKSGATIASATCINPVAEQYELGHQIGVSGTPAIVLEDGRLLPGYMPAADLAKTIGIQSTEL